MLIFGGKIQIFEKTEKNGSLASLGTNIGKPLVLKPMVCHMIFLCFARMLPILVNFCSLFHGQNSDFLMGTFPKTATFCNLLKKFLRIERRMEQKVDKKTSRDNQHHKFPVAIRNQM